MTDKELARVKDLATRPSACFRDCACPCSRCYAVLDLIEELDRLKEELVLLKGNTKDV
jgi:hypothetical protein